MNTKAVCKKLSVTPKMLRIYEDNGLVQPKRLENNYRDYSPENIMQIETISVLRRLGFSITEIKSIIAFDKTQNEYLDMLYLQYKAIEARVKDLEDTKTNLMATINKMIRSGDEKSFGEIILAEHEKERIHMLDYESMVKEWDFDEMAPFFITRYMENDLPYKETIKKLQGKIKSMEGKSFTDVGCGTCNMWQGISKDADVLAIDLSLPMLFESREKLPWIKRAMDDILTLDPEQYRKSDVVISAFMLHHIEYEDQYRAIDNIFRLVKPGGTVIIADRCYRSSEFKNDDITSEYFLMADEIEKYLIFRGSDVDVEFTDENMVIFTVQV